MILALFQTTTGRKMLRLSCFNSSALSSALKLLDFAVSRYLSELPILSEFVSNRSQINLARTGLVTQLGDSAASRFLGLSSKAQRIPSRQLCAARLKPT